MPADPAAVPCVALLGPGGPGGPALAQAIEARMRELGCPPPHWLFSEQARDSQAADLRWLLAPDPDAPDEMNALAAQQALRSQLHALGLAYLVLRGSPAERLAMALQSLVPWRPALRDHLPQVGVASRRPGRWTCDTCGDPACEHLGLQALVASRQGN